MYGAERKLQEYFQAKRLTAAKVLSTQIDNLDITEDSDSGSLMFTGKIVAKVSFIDDNQLKTAELPVTVLDSQLALVDKEIEKALSEASAEAEEAPIDPTKVTASLTDFKVVDDGTKYLKVYHTAAYGDLEPIGAVSKDEYTEAEGLEALLTEMFKDEATSWPADVSFEGEFTEPEITEASPAPEDVQYVVKVDPSLEKEAEEEVNMEYRYKSHDNIRLSVEKEKMNYDALQSRITQRAIVTLSDSLRSNRMGTFKIKDASTTYDPETKMGTVVVQTELLDGRDTKLISLEVAINGESMTLPTIDQVTSMLKEAKPVENKPVIKKEAKKKRSLEKKAGAMSPSNTDYQEVLRMPKDFLPKSLKEGDVIEVDGLRWKLTSKSEGQLSKQKDTASHWLFERVRGYEKPIYKQESY